MTWSPNQESRSSLCAQKLTQQILVAIAAILWTPFAQHYFVYRYLPKVKNEHHERDPIKLENLMDLHGDVLKPEGETLISCDIMDLDHLWSQNC